jgi:hypothetical protein
MGSWDLSSISMVEDGQPSTRQEFKKKENRLSNKHERLTCKQ